MNCSLVRLVEEISVWRTRRWMGFYEVLLPITYHLVTCLLQRINERMKLAYGNRASKLRPQEQG